jgi:hypothetical protein
MEMGLFCPRMSKLRNNYIKGNFLLYTTNVRRLDGMSLKNVNIVELRLVGRTDLIPQNAEDLPLLIMSNLVSISGADRCSVFPRWAVLAFCVGTALL